MRSSVAVARGSAQAHPLPLHSISAYRAIRPEMGTYQPGRITAREMSAHLWWPEDHAWCVAIAIDLMTTCLCASADCVEAVSPPLNLKHSPPTPDQKTTWDSDTVSPVPGSPSSGV